MPPQPRSGRSCSSSARRDGARRAGPIENTIATPASTMASVPIRNDSRVPTVAAARIAAATPAGQVGAARGALPAARSARVSPPRRHRPRARRPPARAARRPAAPASTRSRRPPPRPGARPAGRTRTRSVAPRRARAAPPTAPRSAPAASRTAGRPLVQARGGSPDQRSGETPPSTRSCASYGTPIVALGSARVIIRNGAGPTCSTKTRSAVRPSWSATVSVNGKLPVRSSRPAIAPEASSVSPAGSTASQTYGAAPPTAASCARYGSPARAAGSALVTIESGSDALAARRRRVAEQLVGEVDRLHPLLVVCFPGLEVALDQQVPQCPRSPSVCRGDAQGLVRLHHCGDTTRRPARPPYATRASRARVAQTGRIQRVSTTCVGAKAASIEGSGLNHDSVPPKSPRQPKSLRLGARRRSAASA